MVTIRAAGVDDAAAGAALHIACWREAYAPFTDPEVLARLTDDLEERTERWRSYIAAGPLWLAVADDGALVGFAMAGPGRDDDIDLDLELYAIYVRASQYGTGVGHRLFKAAIGEAPAYLWVLEANARARGFYRRQGFEPDGGGRVEREFNAQEIRLRRGGWPGRMGRMGRMSGPDRADGRAGWGGWPGQTGRMGGPDGADGRAGWGG